MATLPLGFGPYVGKELKKISPCRSRGVLIALVLAFGAIIGSSAESQASIASETPNGFQVQVCARFRPLSSVRSGPKGRHKVVLPLHQRLQLIQKQENCTTKQARRLLWEPRGGKSSPWMDSDVRTPQKQGPGSVSGGDSTGYQEIAGDQSIEACLVNLKPGIRGSVLMCCPAQGLREFTLDSVADGCSSQQEIYEAAAAVQVQHFLAGNDVCIFAYGQTGSGKTHSMFGRESEETQNVSESCDDEGIVQRACREVANAVGHGEEGAGQGGGGGKCVEVAMVEVFGDSIIDLLGGEDNSEAAKSGNGRIVTHRAVESGQTSLRVKSHEDMATALRRGMERRRRAATAMNDRSSRAHCLVMLRVVDGADEEGSKGGTVKRRRGRCPTLCLADLGGSEQVSKSVLSSTMKQMAGKEEIASRLGEAIEINLGLLALKNCVRALLDKRPHVPYHDSKLTLLLKNALGGSCLTSVLVTVRGEEEHALATIDSLRFATALSSLHTLPAADAHMAAAMEAIKDVEAQIADVEEEIARKEQWVTTYHTRPDVRHQSGEATGAEERVSKSTLVGAEAERALLARLLTRRAVLLGS